MCCWKGSRIGKQKIDEVLQIVKTVMQNIRLIFWNLLPENTISSTLNRNTFSYPSNTSFITIEVVNLLTGRRLRDRPPPPIETILKVDAEFLNAYLSSFNISLTPCHADTDTEDFCVIEACRLTVINQFKSKRWQHLPLLGTTGRGTVATQLSIG